jgi:hypothetical protein
MRIAASMCRVVVMALAVVIAGIAQEDVLKPSSPDVRSLRSLREPLQMFGFGPFEGPVERVTSPDSQALQVLGEAASNGGDYLRAVTDLLAVYESMQCEPDRVMLKPLLEDRLRLYSRLLGFEAEKAALPLGPPSIIKLPATGKKALKLRDDLLAAKNKLDEIVASLK